MIWSVALANVHRTRLTPSVQHFDQLFAKTQTLAYWTKALQVSKRRNWIIAAVNAHIYIAIFQFFVERQHKE